MDNNNLEKINNNKESDKIYTSNIIAIIMTAIPAWLWYESFMDKNETDSALGWVIILYYWTLGIPFAITSLIIGIVNVKKNRNRKIAFIIMLLNLLPIIFMAGLLLEYLISDIVN